MTDTSKSKAANNRPAGVRVTAAKCVRCKAPVTARFRPFCSQRCSDIDLAGWLTGQYRIPTDEQVESGDPNVELDED
ncbi:MAG: DNA gyrase inhibitor YacG [Rhodospirillaceae bacterium]